MVQAYVSVGSNIEPQQHIRAGLADMQQQYGQLTISSVYESEAVGFSGDNFYNLVVGFETAQPPLIINQTLRVIEQTHGRIRSQNKFSARTLDLDLILYGDMIFQEDKLVLPRDEILNYAFVLLPLAEIIPNAKHPITQQTYRELWQNFDKSKQLLWQVAIDLTKN